MACTVKKLAKLSGVSIRTLRFYDEIGLLPPAFYGENGYRYYEEKELLRLQQILFFRELDFPLADIERVLKQGGFDQLATLQSHKQALEQKLSGMHTLLQTLDKTILHLKKEIKMKNEELYRGFSPEKQAY